MGHIDFVNEPEENQCIYIDSANSCPGQFCMRFVLASITFYTFQLIYLLVYPIYYFLMLWYYTFFSFQKLLVDCMCMCIYTLKWIYVHVPSNLLLLSVHFFIYYFFLLSVTGLFYLIFYSILLNIIFLLYSTLLISGLRTMLNENNLCLVPYVFGENIWFFTIKSDISFR